MGIEIEKSTKNYTNGFYVEYYYKKGNTLYYHREAGPAYIEYSKYGLIEREEYWINNKFHREDGPANIVYNPDSSIRFEEYYINNKRLTKEDWYVEYGWREKLKGTPMGEIFK